MIGSVTYLNNTLSLENRIYQLVSGNLQSTNRREEIEFDNSSLSGIKKTDSFTELSEAEKQYIEKLKEREEHVKRHEQAHISAGGDLVRGGANYHYKMGPDGKRYIVGGNVMIDTSSASGNPEKNIAKAQKIKQAALAPADPSPTDRQVVAQASKMEQEARAELEKEKQEERQESSEKILKLTEATSKNKSYEDNDSIRIYDSRGEVKKLAISGLNVLL